MELIATLTSPLAIFLPRKTKDDKKFILNLNNYRNTHHIVLNQTKIAYKEVMQEQIDPLPLMETVRVRYRLFPKTKRLTDTSNVCCIHEKYFADALVEAGKLPDDNYLYYLETGYAFGSIDKENPRVEIELFI